MNGGANRSPLHGIVGELQPHCFGGICQSMYVYYICVVKPFALKPEGVHICRYLRCMHTLECILVAIYSVCALWRAYLSLFTVYAHTGVRNCHYLRCTGAHICRYLRCIRICMQSLGWIRAKVVNKSDFSSENRKFLWKIIFFMRNHDSWKIIFF